MYCFNCGVYLPDDEQLCDICRAILDEKRSKKMKDKYIICGFSGVGKSTAEQKHNNVVDFESSAFSHFFDPQKMGEKNPEFPRNYIDALCELVDKGKGSIYLLSCHQEVRDELKARGIDYIIVMPSADQKNEYLKRWLKRGSSVEFIKMMREKWLPMICSCQNDEAPKIFLGENEYIDDVLPR
jgi:hypothetical protein